VRKRAKRKEEWTGPLICLSGVDVVYNTGTEALKNCNLKVEKDAHFFQYGPYPRRSPVAPMPHFQTRYDHPANETLGILRSRVQW